MRAELLSHVLMRATQALQSIPKTELLKLSLPDCAFMLNTLTGIHELAGLRAQLASRLHAQLDTSWIKDGDMYEVFSALTALWKFDPAKVSGEQLACAVQRLVHSEVTAGGPYYAKDKVDITANAQIAIFMRLVAKPLPKLDAFLADFVTTQSFTDTRLTYPYLLYVLSDAHNTPELTRYVLPYRHAESWQTPWRKAIALSILRSGGQVPESQWKVTALCAQQQSNGFWEGEPLLSTQQSGACRHFTATALVLRILTDYQNAQPRSVYSYVQRRHQIIAQAARQMFNTYNEPLRTSALATINQMCDADKNFEITLLPQYFAHALETQASLTSQQCITLGLASLYVWMAYTIYDDFLDDEGMPAKLPIANIAMRTSLDCFRAALPDQNFQQYVARIFAAMDEANAWELGHCRFAVSPGKVTITELPLYGDCSALAARSFAHALAPMAVLAQLLPGNSKACVSDMESAFRHYLIARQLNDDIHDWLKDMQTGQANYAVTAILRDMRVRPGTYNSAVLLLAMQKRFRRTTMLKICRRILWHARKSRKAFVQTGLLHTPNTIYSLLDNLELSVQDSLDKHSKAQAFHDSTSQFGWR